MATRYCALRLLNGSVSGMHAPAGWYPYSLSWLASIPVCPGIACHGSKSPAAAHMVRFWHGTGAGAMVRFWLVVLQARV